MCTGLELLSAFATGMQVVGQLSKGQQQQDYYEWQSAQSAADAQAEREAADVRAEKIRKLGDRQQSEARAALAAAGVEVGAGTAVRIDQQIERDAEYDARQELLAGGRRASRLESDAQGYRIAGENAFGNSILAAGGGVAKGWIKINDKSAES